MFLKHWLSTCQTFYLIDCLISRSRLSRNLNPIHRISIRDLCRNVPVFQVKCVMFTNPRKLMLNKSSAVGNVCDDSVRGFFTYFRDMDPNHGRLGPLPIVSAYQRGLVIPSCFVTDPRSILHIFWLFDFIISRFIKLWTRTSFVEWQSSRDMNLVEWDLRCNMVPLHVMHMGT